MTDPIILAMQSEFPKLVQDGGVVTSQPTPEYNCIAWAAGDTTSHWWPDIGHGPPIGGYYWPAALPLEVTTDNFIHAFKRQGYRLATDGSLEDGIEKIALYVDAAGVPTHAARQLEDGRWTSKLGDEEDISHGSPSGVEGPVYGTATVYMRRKRRPNRPPPGSNDEFFAE